MIPVLSIHQPYASLIFAPAHCGECGGSGLTDDRDSDGYPRPAQCVCQHPQHPRVKRWETRSWPCPAKYVGQRIAIAATGKPEKPECSSCLASCRWVDDAWVCRRCGDEFYEDPSWPDARPTGCIVGTVVVARSLPIVDEDEVFRRARLTEDAFVTDSSRWRSLACTGLGSLRTITSRMDGTAKVSEVVDISDQQPYGYWEPGGWAWELTDPQPTTERCPWWDGMVNLGPHCPVCNGKGRCDPIPVKGRQGIWQWDGTRRPT